jgi:hypothetical protein
MPRRPTRRRSASRARRRVIFTLAPLAALAAGGALALVWLLLVRSGGNPAPAGPPTAAIVDQLSFNVPNPDFAVRTTALLQQQGYKVDYYPYEQVNVDFYRRLAGRGYKLIIFRSHASRLQAEYRGQQIDEVNLFTSEPYDETKYISDQAANRLVIAQYTRDGPKYFGIAPDFFSKTAGKFKDTTIVMMGCEGLLSTRTAQAFVDLGAKTYISWDESVTASHTDQATEVLLQHLLVEKKTGTDAAALTMADVGTDPVYHSTLRAYPTGS